MKIKFYLAFVLVFSMNICFQTKSFSQCENCDVTINNNGNATNTPVNLANGATICITANNRSSNIDLRNRNDLKICIAEGASFSGQFQNYNPEVKITVNVYGTFRGALTLNNNNSEFNVFSNGVYSNNGTLTVIRGNVINQGVISGPIILRNSSTFTNDGSFLSSINVDNLAGVIINNSGIMNATAFTDNSTNYIFNSLPGSIFSVSGNRTIRGVWNIGGEVNFGDNLTLENTGSNGIRINLSGDGELNVGQDLITNRGISASGNSVINVNRDFRSEVNGDVTNGTILNNNASLTIGRNALANGPITGNNNSIISINGNLEIPNVGAASININNNSSILVNGNTNVRGPLRFRDESIGTFVGNVNLFNVGGSVIDLQNNSDVLIQSNLTAEAFGSSVIVRNSSQLVICNARAPLVEIEGSFPPQSRWGTTIDNSPAYYGGCRILPVEFLDINATFSQEARTSQITWATAKEWENSHFEVERSIDNINNFEKIGEIEGVGYSDERSDYSFTDVELPLIGSMAYYRVKQVDFSGSYAYSKTVGVNIPQVHTSKGTWRAYPNPTNGEQLKIALVDRGQYAEEQITFRIIHPSLVTQSISVRSEREMNDSLSQLITRVPKGVFVVEIQWGQKVEHIKVLKK